MLTTLQLLSARLRNLERYGIEVLLILCSIWAAAALWAAPDPFEAKYGQYFWALAKIDPHTDHWAVYLVLGAFLKIIGLGLCSGSKSEWGLPARGLGLVVSGLFWLSAGISTIVVNPTTIGGGPMTVLGASAVWVLIRFPAMPRS